MRTAIPPTASVPSPHRDGAPGSRSAARASSGSRPARLLAVALLCLTTLATGAELMARPQEGGRVVVLGFRGVDAGLARQWIDSGDLPELAALAAEGSLAELRPTNPPQAGVSWATFMTGLNPGRTGITGIIRRQEQSTIGAPAVNSPTTEPYRIQGLRSGAFGLVAGTVVGMLAGVVFLLWRQARRGFRRRQQLRHGSGMLKLLAVLVVGMIGGIAGSSFADRFLPTERPAWENHREGTPFWSAAAEAGVRARIVRVPGTFPARAPAESDERVVGELLAGLGVPDIRGTEGTPTLYTTDPALQEGDDLGVEIIKPDRRRQPLSTWLPGPPNLLYDRMDRGTMRDRGVPERIDLELTIDWRPDDDAAVLGLPTADEVRLEAGEWSEWVELTFSHNLFIRTRGLARFHLVAAAPELRLYVTPVQPHPADSADYRLTAPPEHGASLWERFGPFKTVGHAIDTRTVAAGLADEGLLVDDVERTVEPYRRLLLESIGRTDWDLHVQVFSFPDRVSHLMWRHLDPEHPAHDPELAGRWGGAILDAYRRMDRIVGEVRDALGPQDRLLVLSDHGFASWRRSFNVNAWLLAHGYLALREDAPEEPTLYTAVDWAETRAYSLGEGQLFVNVIGREPRGTIGLGDDYRALKAEISERIEAWIDPDTGISPVHRVWDRSESMDLFDPLYAADLRVATAPPYRVGRAARDGGIADSIVGPNDSRWSGDHSSLDPALVPGILVASIPGLRPDPWIGDLAPTVLALLGVPAAADLDGESLLPTTTR